MLRTDRRTDGQTDGQAQINMLLNFFERGGIKTMLLNIVKKSMKGPMFCFGQSKIHVSIKQDEIPKFSCSSLSTYNLSTLYTT